MASILISDQSFIISVSQGTGCYRHIKISESDTLFDLHTAVLNAFKIDDSHAHAFFLDNVLWSDINSYFDGFYLGINRRTIDYRLDKVLYVGKRFKYLFDFGGESVFQCNVLRETDAVCMESTVIRSKGDVLIENEDALPVTQTVQNILTYFDAFACLYGIITIDKAFEIYNAQNEAVSRDVFTDAWLMAKCSDKCYIIHENNEIVNLDLLNDCFSADHYAFTALKKLQSDKPFYIPDKETLLKQADDSSGERDIYFYELVQFLKTETHLPDVKADEVADEILFLCFKEEDTDQIMLFIHRIGLDIIDIYQAARFQDLLKTLQDNTRLWSNRGYTSAELRDLPTSASEIIK